MRRYLQKYLDHLYVRKRQTETKQGVGRMGEWRETTETRRRRKGRVEGDY